LSVHPHYIKTVLDLDLDLDSFWKKRLEVNLCNFRNYKGNLSAQHWVEITDALMINHNFFIAYQWVVTRASSGFSTIAMYFFELEIELNWGPSLLKSKVTLHFVRF
jgi:hypothetical protein